MIVDSEKFEVPYPLSTPVLFLIFNRLSVTKKVFQAIQKAKPPKLYIACDGARDFVSSEESVVQSVRDFVLSNIDWECQVETLFRDKNLGCKVAVSSAIDWFFENEEMGIIIEDDCLPAQSFFWFCEEALKRYKNDMRIWHIAGNNFNSGWKRDPDNSYYFSYYGSIWGWATWRDRWAHYSVKMDNYEEFKEKKYLIDLFGNKKEAHFRIDNFERIKRGLDTWDFQWVYTRLINSGLSIVPIVNLVKNLGFGDDATHTFSKRDKRANMDILNLKIPLSHPSFIVRDKKSDDKFFSTFIYNFKYLIKKIIRR